MSQIALSNIGKYQHCWNDDGKKGIIKTMGVKHFEEYSKWSIKVSSWAKLFGSMLRALSLS